MRPMITNFNYDQNWLSIFLKTIINQSKIVSDKTYTKEDYLHSTYLEKMCDFPSMQLGNKSTRNERMGKNM